MGRNVLVFAEIRDGKIRQVTWEALTAAKTIKEEGEVTVAALGEVESSVFDQMAAYGADRVISIPDPRLTQYTTDGYVAAWKKVIEQVSPEVIFAGHTSIGKDVSPRIAAHFGIGLISDCTQITIQDGELIFTRPIYAGKAFESRKAKDGMVFATIRPNNLEIADPDQSRKATVEERFLDLEEGSLRTIVKEAVRKAGTGGVDLSEAQIVIAGGRGVKSADGFQPIQELADVLGAAVGASRGACDAGFCDYALQIGQTGKVVTPDLYIACGISGAIQHVAGMSASKVIVAINKDPEAPIFQIADFGIVGDLFEVVPLLTKEFRQLLSKND